MNQLADMRLLVKIADTGSFSGAARTVGISQSTVSRSVARMEERLGAQLLRRTTRGLMLTEAGHDYYRAALDVVAGIDAVEARIGRGQGSADGALRVSLPPALSRRYVIPYLGAFLAMYPGISFEFDVSERPVGLVESGMDLALRFGAIDDSRVTARRIGAVRYVTVASPAFIDRYGLPESPEGVSRTPCLVYASAGVPEAWTFCRNGAPVSIVPLAAMRTNDPEHLCDAALRGLGMAHCPAFLVAEHLVAGTLVEVLPSLAPAPCRISAVSAAGHQQPMRTQLFVDFLVDTFAGIPELSVTLFRPSFVGGAVSS